MKKVNKTKALSKTKVKLKTFCVIACNSSITRRLGYIIFSLITISLPLSQAVIPFESTVA